MKSAELLSTLDSFTPLLQTLALCTKGFYMAYACVFCFFSLSLFHWVTANSAMHIMNSQKSKKQHLAHRGH